MTPLSSAALRSRVYRVAGVFGLAAVLLGFTGCKSDSTVNFPALDAKGRPIFDSTNAPSENSPPIMPAPLTSVLKEGDVLRIEFPGAPNLNATKTIVNGKLDLYLIGEVVAAGKTVNDLQKELAERYRPQVISSSVNITVQSSAFSVFVSGAVLRPGEISSDKPITAAEAILKAGVDFSKANLKKVKVTRNVNGRYENATLDLDRVLHGKGDSQPYYLKPGDSLFVPEKFVMF